MVARIAAAGTAVAVALTTAAAIVIPAVVTTAATAGEAAVMAVGLRLWFVLLELLLRHVGDLFRLRLRHLGHAVDTPCRTGHAHSGGLRPAARRSSRRTPKVPCLLSWCPARPR